jgi:hypothetical protein
VARCGGGLQVQAAFIATAYIPNSRPSEEQKEHEDNENEIHIFLQNVWWEIFLPAHVGAE